MYFHIQHPLNLYSVQNITHFPNPEPCLHRSDTISDRPRESPGPCPHRPYRDLHKTHQARKQSPQAEQKYCPATTHPKKVNDTTTNQFTPLQRPSNHSTIFHPPPNKTPLHKHRNGPNITPTNRHQRAQRFRKINTPEPPAHTVSRPLWIQRLSHDAGAARRREGWRRVQLCDAGRVSELGCAGRVY